MTVPPEVVGFIRTYPRFLILGHKEPDGDCISSQLAFKTLLESLGKIGILISAGPFDRPEISLYEGMFSRDVGDADKSAGTAVVVLDCSTADRIGPPGEHVAGLPVLVIDHHSSGTAFGDVRFVMPAVPATTFLVLAVSDAFGLTPSAEQARLMLFGLCTDTGFFRHLGPGTGDTFHGIARLVDLGASTAEIFQMVFGRRDLASRKLLALMLQRTESFWGDRLLMTWQSNADRGPQEGYLRGEDDLYRLLQTVKGNEVVVLIKEESEGLYSAGLRSNRAVDVGSIAASFGGGGHRLAAGCDIRGTLESVKKNLIGIFARVLDDQARK